MIGFYIPIWARSRDYDCFSKFIGIGNSITNYFYYFDEAYNGTTLDTIIIAAIAGVDLINIFVGVDACLD
jgi:hypothetical protein